MLRRLVNLALLMPCLAYGAGWDTNSWPAWSHSRSGAVWATECKAAIQERFDGVYGTGSLANITLPREVSLIPHGQIRNLMSIKFYIDFLLDDGASAGVVFVDTNYAVSGSYDTYFDSRAGATNPPPLTIYQACTNANLPTNILDYTPARPLSGLGNRTNGADYAAIGHPHGLTNAFTAQGGTNTLPAGRTEWYTSDYGWDAVKALINELVWIWSYPMEWGWGYYIDAFVNTTTGLGVNSNKSTWANAKLSAVSNLVFSAGGAAAEEGTAGSLSGGGGYTARVELELSTNRLDVTQAVADTGIKSECDFYWIGRNYDPSGYDVVTFNANTENVVSNKMVRRYTASASTNRYRYTDKLGSTNIPTWCSEPATNASQSEGYFVDGVSGDEERDHWWIIKFDVADGFTYTDD